MPAPVALAPLALKAAALSAAAGLAYLAARRSGRTPLNDAEETALDRLPEGADLALRGDAGRARADLRARMRRAIRLGPDGPGFAIEAGLIARLRLGAIPAGGRG